MGAIASRNQLRMSLLRWVVVCVPAMLLLGFLAGNAVPVGDENGWYQALEKSSATPPGWAFGAAWTALYALLGLSLAIILNARGAKGRALGLVLFVVTLMLNIVALGIVRRYREQYD